MRYINTKTGVTFSSPCEISGGDWVLADELELEELVVEEEELEEVDEEETEEDINLEELTNADLKDLALQYNIDLGNARTKVELVEKLSEHPLFAE